MKEIDAYPLDVKLLEQLLDDLPIGALILDDQGIIRRFNKYEEQLSGLPRQKTIGKSFFSEVAPCTKDIELGPKFHEGIANGSLDLSVEFSFPYPYNRVPRDVFIRAKSIRAGGEVAHIVLIEDIVAVNNLDEILEVDHIDVFFVAPSDLASSMDLIGQLDHPEVVATREGALKKIVESGRAAGTLTFNDNVGHFTDMGVRFDF